jgi:hypothetical protein
MPRNGSGVYSPPAGTLATTLTPIESAKYNAFVNDLTSDANAARPISVGGTGGTSVSTAQTALSLDNKVVYAAKAGNYTALAADNNAVHRYTATATVTLTAAATLAANWHYTVIADGADVTIDPNGAETINGAGTLVIQNGRSAFIICSGAAFFATVVTPASSSVAQCRLTLESGVAISTSDQLAKTTLYLTPYLGNQVSLYNGFSWLARSFVETSLSLSGFTSGKPYDIFAYDNAGTLALEALVWTNDTTRATAIAYQDGVPVKSGAATRRLVGTIYTSATGQTQLKFGSAAGGGDPAYIGIDNVYNRVSASVFVADTTSSWAKTSGGAIEALNASNGNRVSFVSSLPGAKVDALLTARITSALTAIGSVGFGLDSTTVYNARAVNPTVGTNQQSSVFISTQANYSGYPGIGFHFLQALQFSSAATTTYSGSSNQTGFTAQLDY